jgi:hypothetical protein
MFTHYCSLIVNRGFLLVTPLFLCKWFLTLRVAIFDKKGTDEDDAELQ